MARNITPPVITVSTRAINGDSQAAANDCVLLGSSRNMIYLGLNFVSDPHQ